MRVLHAHSGNMYGGVETLLSTLVRYSDACPAMEFEFALSFDGKLSAELREEGAKLYQMGEVRLSRPLSTRRARRAFGRLLGSNRFDVVVCHSVWALVIFGPVVRSVGLPLVLWVHDMLDGRHWLQHLARATRPDLALCNSNFTAGTLPSVYPTLRSEVVYCPIAPPEGDGFSGDREAVRREESTPQEDTVILQVSRMEPLKGQRSHLAALATLRELPGWTCWMVGGAARRQYEVEYFHALRSEAERLGIADRVRFLGMRSDVARLFAAADVYCQPNLGPEGFGLTFVEALQAGLPVVTSDIGGAVEIVDETCGILVPPGDVPALSSTLLNLIQSPELRKRLGEAGPARARRLCDPATQIAQLSRALSSVLS